MQGNHKEVRGTQDEIFDDILWRILTIYGSKDMTTPYETFAPVLKLNQYLKMQPTFKGMFNAAQAFFQRGLIEDNVQLSNYGSCPPNRRDGWKEIW
jgi:hypothetical protein